MPLRGVGVHIKCECPLLAFGCSLSSLRLCLRSARARRIGRLQIEVTSGEAKTGGMSCDRLGRDEDLPEAEDPRGGVSALMGMTPRWTSGEEVAWPLTFGDYVWPINFF